MPTVSKPLVDNLIANDGYYLNDPRILAALTYNNQFDDQLSYAIAYNKKQLSSYLNSGACKNVQIIWKAKID